MNLIDMFLEKVEEEELYLKRTNGEIVSAYLFMGKKEMLCIDKEDEKILSKIPLKNIEIHLTGDDAFTILSGSKKVFFYLSPISEKIKLQEVKQMPELEKIETVEEKKAPVSLPKKEVKEENEVEEFEPKKSRSPQTLKRPIVDLSYKDFCDECLDKKCNNYDKLNGKRFNFGEGPVSEDMYEQYNNYCKLKIEKFKCFEEE